MSGSHSGRNRSADGNIETSTLKPGEGKGTIGVGVVTRQGTTGSQPRCTGRTGDQGRHSGMPVAWNGEGCLDGTGGNEERAGRYFVFRKRVNTFCCQKFLFCDVFTTVSCLPDTVHWQSRQIGRTAFIARLPHLPSCSSAQSLSRRFLCRAIPLRPSPTPSILRLLLPLPKPGRAGHSATGRPDSAGGCPRPKTLPSHGRSRSSPPPSLHPDWCLGDAPPTQQRGGQVGVARHGERSRPSARRSRLPQSRLQQNAVSVRQAPGPFMPFLAAPGQQHLLKVDSEGEADCRRPPAACQPADRPAGPSRPGQTVGGGSGAGRGPARVSPVEEPRSQNGVCWCAPAGGTGGAERG